MITKQVVNTQQVFAKAVIAHIQAAVQQGGCMDLGADRESERWLNKTVACMNIKVCEMRLSDWHFTVVFFVRDKERFGLTEDSCYFALQFVCDGDYCAHLCEQGFGVDGHYFRKYL